MIRKASTTIITDGEAVTAGGMVASAWFGMTDKVAVTTHVTTEFKVNAQNEHPLVEIQVADDRAGTNPVSVFRMATLKGKTPVISHVSHRHKTTDRFIRVLVNNPGNAAGATVTLNAKADHVENIG